MAGGEGCRIPHNASTTRAEQCAYVAANAACHVDSFLDYLHAALCSDATDAEAGLLLAALLAWWILPGLQNLGAESFSAPGK